MQDGVSRETFEARVSILGLDAIANDRLTHFFESLENTAKRAGLIGSSDAGTHILRALCLLELPQIRGAGLIIDVGTGAGLPGVPLSIAGCQVVLIEPKRRAVAFLEKSKRDLGIEVVVLPMRAEQAVREWESKADVVIARGLAAPDDALRLCAPLCRPGGSVVLTASTRLAAPSRDLLERLGFGPNSSVKLGVPLEIEQHVNIMRKTDQHPFLA
ncbi:MAG: 16S rRNA (guanine(527)-N(7))-methyltransferase RsmG [Actinomycetota bacterium]|nr:class I SAM-dependent methyltransferase [Actinomycetota bacterium]